MILVPPTAIVNASSMTLAIADLGLWIEVKERVEYGRRGDGGC